MRVYKYCAVSVILSAVGLAACGTKTDTQPDIFKTLSQSEFLTNNAAETPCEDNADIPAATYHRLCFQINSVTIPSLDQAGEIGLNIGKKIQPLFKNSDWEIVTDNPDIFYYRKYVANGCVDKLFFDFSGGVNSDEIDYPFEFAPRLSFSKLRQPVCEKS